MDLCHCWIRINWKTTTENVFLLLKLLLKKYIKDIQLVVVFKFPGEM